MQQALQLAEKGRGLTGPNPMVGAVIVKNKRVVGQGYHQKAGGPHAEVLALKQADKAARSAELYVNLEPCVHQGKTPPCVPTIIKSGIESVHVAMRDPNPRVNGKGIIALRNAGISVVVGEHEGEAEVLNEVFVTNMEKKRPFITAKFAMSLDGKIATKTGDSQWISGRKSRKFVHKLRSQADAIIVGVGTILADDPQLTVRTPGKNAHQPLRIILDTHGKTPFDAHVVSEDPGKTVLVVWKELAAGKIQAFKHSGIEVIPLPQVKDRLDLKKLMDMLFRRNITTVLVEGGGTTFASFFESCLVDKIYAFIAPKIIGGKDAVTPVEGAGVTCIAQVITLTDMKVKKIENDVLIVANTHCNTKQPELRNTSRLVRQRDNRLSAVSAPPLETPANATHSVAGGLNPKECL